jgi:tetratricopeptide (TPR) repeat protein
LLRARHCRRDQATAQTLAERAAVLAEEADIPHQQANALYCRGMVERDASVLLAAAQRYADAGRPLPRAKALEAAATCLVEADDRMRARQAFEQAVEVYEFLGAEADLNRVHSEFRTYGIRRGPHSKPRRAVSGWDSLTGGQCPVPRGYPTALIYMDESTAKASGGRFFVVGAVKVRKSGQLMRAIRDVRDRHGFYDEFKFSRISRGKFSVFCELCV